MPHHASGYIVAVIDDDAAILRSLEYLLESADYGVRLFASGAELLSDSCIADIDCVVSDIEMSGIDGFELLQRLHAVKPGLPVIFITAYPETIERLSTLDETKPHLFTKPFRGQDMLTAIDEALHPPS